MKKIALFLSAMVLCIGIAMAQEPIKKANNEKAKTEKQTVSADKAVAKPTAKSCGNCPHHKQCNNSANAQAVSAKPENKGCCDKNGKKECNKEGNAKACNKGVENKSASTK